MQLGPEANTNDPSRQASESDTLPANQPTTLQDGAAPPPAEGSWLDQFRAENSMLPNILMIVGMVVLVMLMFRSLKRTHKSNAARTNAMGTPSERIDEIRHRAESSMAPGERLMVEAEDIARRLGAVLDNKAARLELLIEEADTKLDLLNRAISDKPRAGEQAQTPVIEQPAPPPSPSPRAIDPTLMDRARLEQDQHEREGRVAGRIEPAPMPAKPAEVPISDQIQQLALQGKSPSEIAQDLKQPIGQVELIINLQRRAEQS